MGDSPRDRTLTFRECSIIHYMYHQKVREAANELDEFTREELRKSSDAPRTIVDDVIDELSQKVEQAIDDSSEDFTREELETSVNAPRTIIDDVIEELRSKGEIYEPRTGIFRHASSRKDINKGLDFANASDETILSYERVKQALDEFDEKFTHEELEASVDAPQTVIDDAIAELRWKGEIYEPRTGTFEHTSSGREIDKSLDFANASHETIVYHQRVRQALEKFDDEFTREELEASVDAPPAIVEDAIDDLHLRGQIYQPRSGIWRKTTGELHYDQEC